MCVLIESLDQYIQPSRDLLEVTLQRRRYKRSDKIPCFAYARSVVSPMVIIMLDSNGVISCRRKQIDGGL